jgi:hypothetical protein
VFADVDVLVTPTTPMAAPAIAELKANPEALRPGGTEVAAQYAAVQCLGTAGDLGAMRIYAERDADWDADRGAALAGGFGGAGGARLRAGDGVAQAAVRGVGQGREFFAGMIYASYH